MSEFSKPSIGQAATDALRWWTGELADLVPPALQLRADEATILLAYQSVRVERRVGTTIEVHADERAVEDLDDEGWEQMLDLVEGLPTRIVLENPLCWTGSVLLPKVARARLQTAVELQLPHAAPIKQEYLVWKGVIREVRGDEIDVAIPMAKRALIETLDSRFSDYGLRTPPIIVRAPDGDRLLRSGSRKTQRERRAQDWILLGAAALVAATPLVTAAIAMFLTSLNEDRIEALKASLAPKIAAEEDWRRDEAARREIAALSKRPAVSDILARLDERVPERVRLTNLSLEQGRKLSMTAQVESAGSVQQAFSDDPSLASLKPVAEVPQDGRLMLVTFEGGTR
jgi:hypothetical protein